MKNTYVSVVNATDSHVFDRSLNGEIKGAAAQGYVLRDIKFSTLPFCEDDVDLWAVLIFDACADVTANGKE